MARKFAATATTLALIMGGCTDNGSAERGESSAAVSMADSDPARLLGAAEGFDFRGTRWQQPERVAIGGVNITVYSEMDTTAASEMRGQLEADIHNTFLLLEAKKAADDTAAPDRPVETDYSLQLRPNTTHTFYLFGSTESIARVHEGAAAGPLTVSRNSGGGRMDNVTLLAPYPRQHFILASDLNDSVFKRQVAVCANIVNVQFSERLRTEASRRLPDDPQLRAARLEDLKTDITLATCESLASPVTARAEGRGFDYYGPLSRVLYTDGLLTGIPIPYIPFSEAQYPKLIV